MWAMINRATSKRPEERTWQERLLQPVIRNTSEARWFIARLVVGCTAGALLLDVLIKLYFFESWNAAFSSWIGTLLIASVVTFPAATVIARAHLALYRANVEMDALSRTDPLTGLPNRRAFLERAENTPAKAMVLIIADVDRFKRINDTHGHLAGDEVLLSISNLLAEEIASLGFLGRVGGEEFAIVTSEIPAEKIVERITALLKRVETTPIIIGSNAISVTISAGIALRTPDLNFTELYAEADRALYNAKALGRNRISMSPAFEALMPPALIAAVEEKHTVVASVA